MRKPHGYATCASPDGRKEFDTVSCCHCQRVQIVGAKTVGFDVCIDKSVQAADLGGWCGKCADYVCGPCVDKGTCTPFEKKLEASEKRFQMLRQMGLV